MSYVSRRARRYAEALFGLADQAGQAAAVGAEMERVGQILAELPELGPVLGHRQIPLARKLELARQAFLPDVGEGEGEGQAPISDLTSNFVRLLIEHRRVELIGEINAALREMLDRRQGVVRATVTTAVPIVKAERERIEAKLREVTGAKQVVIDSRVSKSILGGVVIHIGDHVIDASIRTYLNTLRETLRRVRVSEFDTEGFLDLNLRRLREAGGAAGEQPGG